MNNPSDFSKRCRTCLSQTKGLQLLTKMAFDLPQQQRTFADLLYEVTNINISKDLNTSEMPQYLCPACLRKLKSSHAFIRQAKEADDKCLSMLRERMMENCMNETEIDIKPSFLDIKIETEDVEYTEQSIPEIKEEIATNEDCSMENPLEDFVSTSNQEQNNTKQLIFNNVSDSDWSGEERDTESEADSSNFSSEEAAKSPSMNVHKKKNGSKTSAWEKCDPKDIEDIAAPCSQCDKIFKNSKELKCHLKNAHIPDAEKCACPLCGATFSRSYSMYYHMRTIHGPETVTSLLPKREKPHQCDKCPRKYSKLKYLKYHLKVKHEGKDEQSDVPDGEKIPAPAKKKTEARRPLCSICGSSFPNKTQLTVHMRRHTGDMPFKCDLCDRAFPRISELRYHTRVHTGEKPYKCSICEKTFRVSSKLSSHMRSHTDERPYKCKECEKSFKYSKDLNIHMRTHTGERPYSCNVCGVTFTQSNSLKTHRMKLGHIEESMQTTSRFKWEGLNIENS
ncbi:zinc finger protein 354A [Stomoxys calcitrans]|uniref:zinc finger protein 354A n=1 Tax=Stomoxys calcitrans TaxID=35570 RepID=UPI0027E36605|nr:zinc finger protein 354A [Stomoxys calcitrans]XP_059218312.1 zinc finger protein 354A [Stomoxys calcitrans]